MFIFASSDIWRQPCRPITALVYMEADALIGRGRVTYDHMPQ